MNQRLRPVSLALASFIFRFGRGQPLLNNIIDDRAAALASLERLRGLPAGTVYPGHGRPFPMEMLRQTGR